MSVHSVMGLECRLAVVGRTLTHLDLCRVVEVVDEWYCTLEDTSDHYSS